MVNNGLWNIMKLSEVTFSLSSQPKLSDIKASIDDKAYRGD